MLNSLPTSLKIVVLNICGVLYSLLRCLVPQHSGMIGRPLSTTTSNKTGHDAQLFSSEGEAARQKGDYESCSTAWADSDEWQSFRCFLGGDGLGVDSVLGVRGVSIGPS